MERYPATTVLALMKRTPIDPVPIVMLTPTVVLPAAFVAVTVYTAVAATALGVPEMMPVEVFKLRPDGRSGDTEYDATAPPVLLGVFGEMATPTV